MATKSKPDAAKISLIRDVLINGLGREAANISLNPLSNNTVVYMVALKPAGSGSLTGLKKPSLPGTQALPPDATKVVVRFTNPDANLNDSVRIESEVAAMELARNALKSLDTPIVPRVYAWKAASENQEGWTLMEHMPGIRLEHTMFKKMKPDAKKEILEQIAAIFKQIQQCNLPGSAQGYGGLRFSDGGNITLGPTPIYGATKPCETYHELYTEYLNTQLKFMDQCDVVKGWRDSDLRERIDKFVAEGFQILLTTASEPQPRPVLVHGDFDLHNILFDNNTNRITALLDWDFSHVASAADEYFYSFQSIHSLVAPTTGETSLDKLRECLLRGFADAKVEPKFEDMVHWDVAAQTNQAFAEAGVQRPVDLAPGIELLSEMYWFIQNLSPGAFFLPKFRARNGPEKIAAMRSDFQEGLAHTLSRWGY